MVGDLDGRVVADPPARLVQPPDEVNVLADPHRVIEHAPVPGDIEQRLRGGPAAPPSGT